MKYNRSQSSASLPPLFSALFSGSWLANQTPERRLRTLVSIAAQQVTNKQLAALAGLSVSQFREARRQRGAPIRPKRPLARKADPVPTPEPANVDIVNALRQLGTNGLLQLAELVERDEIARSVVAAKTNGNGAALNGGAVHHTW
jgi:hypothetical protein